MSKVTTKRLSRGIRMLRGHVVGQLKTLLDTPRLAQVSTENLTADKGTFRINLHVPVMKGQNTGSTDHLPIWVPFTLPPTQEFFTTPTPDADGNFPRAVLTEIGFSFDQRSEAAAITRDDTSVPVIEGKLDYEEVGRLGVKVSLYSKEMTHWSSNAPKHIEERILSFDLPNTAYSSPRFRLNPATQSNLSIPIEPLRTYLLEIDCAGLTDTAKHPLQLNSILVSLKFEQQLMGRDVNYGGSVSVQNMPTSHNGQLPTSSASITEPTTASEPIRAGVGGTGTGIQTAFETIDGFFRRLLQGGYHDRRGVTATQQILQDASYEVIAVPLFGNTEGVYSTVAGSPPVANGVTSVNMPYEPSLNGHMFDMRRIPIRYPFVLHHVIAVQNWSPNAKDVLVRTPGVATFINKVGVGIGCGHHAELAGWNSCAYAEWGAVGSAKAAYLIDSVNRNDSAPQKNLGFDMVRVPLVGSTANGTIGTGYADTGGTYPNGKPIFIGSSSSANQARSALADGVAGAVPASRAIEGKEQWIEVRWLISDTTFKFNTAPEYTNQDILIGNGGNWVFLIGKKHLA